MAGGEESGYSSRRSAASLSQAWTDDEETLAAWAERETDTPEAMAVQIAAIIALSSLKEAPCGAGVSLCPLGLGFLGIS